MPRISATEVARAQRRSRFARIHAASLRAEQRASAAVSRLIPPQGSSRVAGAPESPLLALWGGDGPVSAF